VLICIAATVVVSGVEIAVGWHFGLISVLAEGLHTAADLADSLVVLFLVAIAARPADRDHPFGHGKYDSLAATIEGGAVALAAVWAIFKACQVLLGLVPAAPRPELVTLATMGGGSIVYLFVSAYVLRLAKRTQSPAVFAEALHLRTHVYITGGLFAGLVVSRIGLSRGWLHAERIDALTALVLGTFLLVVAYRIIRAGYRQLVDTSLPPEDLETLSSCLKTFRDEFVEVHAIRTRRSGTARHADIHLVVAAQMSVRAAHDLSHRIETALRERLPGTDLLVHVEPAVGETLEAYRQRSGVGEVVDSCASPAEREHTHHDDTDAHRTDFTS
jgi:cation diffusion facilitator family transporter